MAAYKFKLRLFKIALEFFCFWNENKLRKKIVEENCLSRFVGNAPRRSKRFLQINSKWEGILLGFEIVIQEKYSCKATNPLASREMIIYFKWNSLASKFYWIIQHDSERSLHQRAMIQLHGLCKSNNFPYKELQLQYHQLHLSNETMNTPFQPSGLNIVFLCGLCRSVLRSMKPSNFKIKFVSVKWESSIMMLSVALGISDFHLKKEILLILVVYASVRPLFTVKTKVFQFSFGAKAFGNHKEHPPKDLSWTQRQTFRDLMVKGHV